MLRFSTYIPYVIRGVRRRLSAGGYGSGSEDVSPPARSVEALRSSTRLFILSDQQVCTAPSPT